MNITTKLAALVICCAGAIGMAQPAHADGFSIGYHSGGWGGWRHSGYSVSFGTGPAWYGGYYYGGPAYYRPARCYYDYYGYYHCPRYYYGGYAPAVRIGYYGGWGHRWYGGGWYRGGWYHGGWGGWRGGWHHGWHGGHWGHGPGPRH